MWTMHPELFASAVASDKDPDALLVRFRHRDHLDRLIKMLTDLGYPEPKVLAFGWSDYAWRAVVPRDQYKALLASWVDDITYTNFKDETTKRSGRPLHDAYMGVWGVMHKVQAWPGALRGKAEAVAATPQPEWAHRPATSYARDAELGFPRDWDYRRPFGSRNRDLELDVTPEPPFEDDIPPEERLLTCPGCREGIEALFIDPAQGPGAMCPACEYEPDDDEVLKPYVDLGDRDVAVQESDPTSPFYVSRDGAL